MSQQTCRRYTANGTRCARVVADGQDHCGVCAGHRSPQSTIGEHRAQSLKETRAQTIQYEAAPMLDAKAAGWQSAAENTSVLVGLDDAAVSVAARRSDLDLPDATVIASEAEARNLGVKDHAVAHVQARQRALQGAHRDAVAAGPDPQWQAHVRGVAAERARNVEVIQEELAVAVITDPEGPTTAEMCGRLAAEADFQDLAGSEMLQSPAAADAWVDSALCDGGFPRGDRSRAQMVGYRAQVADIGAHLSI